ncbi:hypothetical protein [Sphingomonas sanguinis]|uniref:hypothetical protein n=1 Tax=Sphingomonas sanguinis TaxID=33051 RepID=UPI00128F75F1|nr:hypothetical protein [Sphingomonas sanguinis]
MKSLDDNVAKTLEAIADLLEDAVDPWWIITGAAAALYGVTPGPVKDVDVLVSKRDAKRLESRKVAARSSNGPSNLFYSSLFLEVQSEPLNIELMADFHIAKDSKWIPVSFNTRNSRKISNKTIYIPSRHELIDLFRCIGRRKDIIRADMLEKLND